MRAHIDLHQSKMAKDLLWRYDLRLSALPPQQAAPPRTALNQANRDKLVQAQREIYEDFRDLFPNDPYIPPLARGVIDDQVQWRNNHYSSIKKRTANFLSSWGSSIMGFNSTGSGNAKKSAAAGDLADEPFAAAASDILESQIALSFSQ